MPVLSALLTYYPHLQALSASSPIWAGVDTGYASNRALMFQQLPTAGLPFQFEEWSQLEGYVDDIERVTEAPVDSPPLVTTRNSRISCWLRLNRPCKLRS